MLKLATAMRKRRSDEGAIDFGDNEVKFELDEQGNRLRWYESSARHQLAH